MSRLFHAALLASAATFLPAVPASAAALQTPTTFAEALDTPWDVVEVPDGRTFITERPGRIRQVNADGSLQAAPVLRPEEAASQTRKFLGLVLHPNWAANRVAYLYVNYGPNGAQRNKILRLREENGRFVVQATVFDGIASDGNHDGGRMSFGPDNLLYVTTRDVHNPDLPQDRQSLNGKILRFAAPGDESSLQPAPDNPFVAEGGNAQWVFSYGHRHPQGLSWGPDGRLYSSEHGPSGENYDAVRYPGGSGRSSRDELNLIERGANYGWPVISGTMTAPGMKTPIATSGDGPVWAPGGLAWGADNRLYMPTLSGSHLREFTVENGQVVAQVERYKSTYGRLRAATAVGNNLLFSQDGGSARVLRVALDGIVPKPLPQPQPEPVQPGPGTVEPVDPTPSAGSTAALTRTLTRLQLTLRRTTTRELLRRGSFSAAAGGFAPGKLRITLTRPRSTRALAVANHRVTSRATLRVRVRLTAHGRQILRRAAKGTLVLRASLTPVTGATERRSRSVRLKR